MKSTTIHTRWIKLPSSLLLVLSDTALRILLYAIDKQGLVTTGTLEVFKLYPKAIENQFSKFKGYSHNPIQAAFRELKELQLIIFKNDHYLLNESALEKWFDNDSADQNQVSGGRPESGQVDKKSTDNTSTNIIDSTLSTTQNKSGIETWKVEEIKQLLRKCPLKTKYPDDHIKFINNLANDFQVERLTVLKLYAEN